MRQINMYIRDYATDQYVARVATIPMNPYDTARLRATLETQLNLGRVPTIGTYEVARSTANGDASTAASGTAQSFFTITLNNESAYGTVIHYAHSRSAYDFIKVGTSALRMHSFSLLDAKLNEIDLKGGHWSMTICLATEET